MPLFSFVTILIVAICFLKNKRLKKVYISLLAAYIFMYMNLEVGYFIKLGDSYIRYSYVLEIIVLFISIILICNNINRASRWLFDASILLTSIAITSLSFIGWPIQKKIVTGEMLIDQYWLGTTNLKYPTFAEVSSLHSIIQLICFTIILSAVISCFKKEDFYDLFKRTVNWCNISIIVGVVEFITKNIFRSNIVQDLIQIIFGENENVFTVMELRGSLFRINGLTTEASHFAYVLFVIAIVHYVNIVKYKGNKLWLVLTLILLLTGMSFSALLFFAGFLAIVFITRNKQILQEKTVYRLFGVIVAVTVAIVLFQSDLFQNTYYGKRLNEVLDSQLLFLAVENVRNIQYSSSLVRLISVTSTLGLIAYRPLFGLGVNAASSHGSFAMILSNIGIVGTFLWLRFLFYNKSTKLFDIHKSAYLLLIILWCTVGLFNSHFLGMMYNAENYIIMLAFIYLCEKDGKGKVKNEHLYRRKIVG